MILKTKTTTTPSLPKKNVLWKFFPKRKLIYPQTIYAMNGSDKLAKLTDIDGKTLGPSLCKSHWVSVLEGSDFSFFFSAISDRWFFVFVRQKSGGDTWKTSPLHGLLVRFRSLNFGLKFTKHVLYCWLLSPRQLIHIRHLTSFFPLSLALNGSNIFLKNAGDDTVAF